MLFPTVTFAAFFVGVLTASWLSGTRATIWKIGLLAANVAFYAWWDERFLVLLGGVILGTHLVACAMTRWPRRQRPLLLAGITANLGVLAFFKYYEFFTVSLIDALEPLHLDPSPPLLEIILPVGISFYVFEAISYLVELRRGTVRRVPLFDLATYLSFFPKLLAGPITRASEFVDQLRTRPPEIETARGLWLIARGLVKKMVIASYLAEHITDGVFATPGQYSAAEVLVGIYAYSVQLYVDFSAYTDMAIGLALLLGYRLPENFDAPYTATTIQGFWARWHMTLTRWFRDFVFQPMVLGGSRGTLATARNIMVVMLLTGLWHGAAWTFVVWGAVHGAAMVAGRLRREHRRRVGRTAPPDTAWRRLGSQLLTFHFVTFAWVLFRADSLERAWDVLARLAEPGPAPAVTPLLVAVVVGALAAQHVPPMWSARAREIFARQAPVAQVLSAGAVLLFVDALGPEGVAPFIYFGF